MTLRARQGGRGGFSLVEVVLALGIFAFAIVVIIGLLSGLLDTSRESWVETRSAQIANGIFRDLAPDSAGKGNDQATATAGIVRNGNSREQVALDGNAKVEKTVYYSIDGQPVAKDAKNADFEVKITLSPLELEAATDSIPARRVQDVLVDVRLKNHPESDKFSFRSRIAPASATAPAP